MTNCIKIKFFCFVYCPENIKYFQKPGGSQQGIPTGKVEPGLGGLEFATFTSKCHDDIYLNTDRQTMVKTCKVACETSDQTVQWIRRWSGTRASVEYFGASWIHSQTGNRIPSHAYVCMYVCKNTRQKARYRGRIQQYWCTIWKQTLSNCTCDTENYLTHASYQIRQILGIKNMGKSKHALSWDREDTWSWHVVTISTSREL